MKLLQVPDDLVAIVELFIEAAVIALEKDTNNRIEKKSIRNAKIPAISQEDLEKRIKNEACYDIREAIEYLATKGIVYKLSTFRAYRSRGEGPPSFIFGNARGKGEVIYFQSDIDTWVSSQISPSFGGIKDFKSWRIQQRNQGKSTK
jgi:hypothetical protein